MYILHKLYTLDSFTTTVPFIVFYNTFASFWKNEGKIQTFLIRLGFCPLAALQAATPTPTAHSALFTLPSVGVLTFTITITAGRTGQLGTGLEDTSDHVSQQDGRC